jgi:lysozyme family protein
MNFDQAFAKLLNHEGDFSDHRDDPGGATRFGITEAVARRVGYRGDMKELPLDLAKRIYKEDYWNPIRADDLPADIRYIVFDAAVNSGVQQASLWLQRSCNAGLDGVIGPKTIAAANASDWQDLKMKYLSQRLRFMTELKNWPSFSRGWTRRICDLMESK